MKLIRKTYNAEEKSFSKKVSIARRAGNGNWWADVN